jgi:hypothetical protein
MDPRYSSGALVFALLLIAFAFFHWSRGLPEPKAGKVDILANDCDSFLVPAQAERMRVSLKARGPAGLVVQTEAGAEAYDFRTRRVATLGQNGVPEQDLDPLGAVPAFGSVRDHDLTLQFDGRFRQATAKPPTAGPAPVTLFSGTLTIALKGALLLRQHFKNIRQDDPPFRLQVRPETGLIVYTALESADPVLSRVIVIQAAPFAPVRTAPVPAPVSRPSAELL